MKNETTNQKPATSENKKESPNKDLNNPITQNNEITSDSGITYKLESIVGRGTFGLVYLASNKNNPKEKFAIKRYFRNLHPNLCQLEISILSYLNQKTSADNILRLYSINPFCEDFVVHAKSIYPSYAETKDCSKCSHRLITQQNTEGLTQQTEYNDIINLLGDNEYGASITLNNSSNNNDVIYKKENSRYIENNTNISKELITYFDLSDLPEDINIDNIEVIVEGESTDNKIDKNTTAQTGLLVPTLESDENIFVPLTPDDTYQLNKKSITFSNDDISTYLKDFSDENVFQEAIIGTFECRIGKEVKIPFNLKENTEEVTDTSKVYLYFDDVLMNGEIIKEDKFGMISIIKNSICSFVIIVSTAK